MTSTFKICICEVSGRLVYTSEDLNNRLRSKLLSGTIFDIDEYYSKSSWKSHISRLQREKSFSEERIIGSEQTQFKAHALYSYIEDGHRDLVLIHYSVVDKSSESLAKATDVEVIASKMNLSESINSPQLLFLLDHKGMIRMTSDGFNALNKNATVFLGKNVSDIFVEYKEEDQNDDLKKSSVGLAMERRLILKTAKRRFIDGFGTIININTEGTSSFILFFREHDLLQSLKDQIQELQQRLSKLKTPNPKDDLVYFDQQIENFSFDNIITSSSTYKSVLAQVAQVADTDTTVLISGETGTGKELLANAVYKLSDRDDQPFIKVNCAVFTKELIESTLFGHEKGSFTGAVDQKIGCFERAHKGTIFLDEIGELSMALQVKLLRVLQSGEFLRLGGNKTITVDVRVIAATNRDLPEMIKQKKFRQDLYYRLNVFPIYSIPLRERKEDIPLLVQHFMKKFNRKMGKKVTQVKKSDLKSLSSYVFPGNIRELENMIERALILSTDNILALSKVIAKERKKAEKDNNFLTLEEVQKKQILKALKLCNGKITGMGSAAELLQINGKTLVSRMKKLGIK